jgi:Tfp pilus assembly protein PilN
MMAFNLLQYPALASQRRRLHRRWTSLAGLVVGGLTALWWMAGLQEQRLHLEQERALLQFRLKQVQTQLATDKARHAKHTTWQQQAAHVQALKVELQAWEDLHQALLQEAGPDSVQLLRFQLDSQTLELHGQSIDLQRMAQAQARLSAPLADLAQDKAWTLVSLLNAAGADDAAPRATQEFVWQTHWPQLGSGRIAAAPGIDRLKAEPLRERP